MPKKNNIISSLISKNNIHIVRITICILLTVCIILCSNRVDLIKSPYCGHTIGIGVYDFRIRQLDNNNNIGVIPSGAESGCMHPDSEFCENDPIETKRFFWVVWDKFKTSKGRRKFQLEGFPAVN